MALARVAHLAVGVGFAEEVAVGEALRAVDGDLQHAQRRRRDAEVLHHWEVHLVGVHQHPLQHILHVRRMRTLFAMQMGRDNTASTDVELSVELSWP